MFRQGVNSGALLSPLFTASDQVGGLWPGSWTSDSSALMFMQWSQGPTSGDILSFHPGANGQPRPFLQTEATEWGARLSPDGRWMAYISNDSGRWEVYIRPYPGPGNRVQVSEDGGTEVVWARTGRELFYRNGQKLFAAQIQTNPLLEVGRRTELFEQPFVTGIPGLPGYDVSLDGTRFLMLKAGKEETEARPLNIVLNWFEELRRRVPVTR